MRPGKIIAACAAFISLTASGLEPGELRLNQSFRGGIALTDVVGVTSHDATPDPVQRNGENRSKIHQQKNLQVPVRDRSADVKDRGEYGKTVQGDTLWSIAVNVAASLDVSVAQAVLALQRANPEAFGDANINALKAGYILRVPELREFIRLSPGAVVAEIRRQNWENADVDITDVRGRVIAEQVREKAAESATKPAGDKEELAAVDLSGSRANAEPAATRELETPAPESDQPEASGSELTTALKQAPTLTRPDIRELPSSPGFRDFLLPAGAGILVIFIIAALLLRRRQRRQASDATESATKSPVEEVTEDRTGNVNAEDEALRPAVTVPPEVASAADSVAVDDVSTATDELPNDVTGKDTDLDPGGDEDTGSKVDLARAYMEMGNKEGALQLLRAALAEGSISEIAEANELLKKLQ